MSQHSPEFMIELQDVYKVYEIGTQRVEALRGVTLKIPRGSICAMTGRSGSGKSSLLHVIGTLDSPTSGSIKLAGVATQTMNDIALSRFRNKTVGFVFQMNNLLPEFTAIENVMMPGLIAGVGVEKLRDRASGLLGSVGLSHRERHRPGELSGGEQQRVAIARSLLMEPPILLADEPTGNLDKNSSEAVVDLLLGLCDAKGVTMLLVTHDIKLAKRLPQQIVIEDGKVVESGGDF